MLSRDHFLGVFLFLALSLSLYGTFVSLSVIDSDTGITGFAPATDTDTATVNLTVDQILDVNWTAEGIDWGEGSVRPDHTNCTLNTNASGNSGGCTGFADKSSTLLVLNNLGNMNVSVNVSFDVDASTFIGGTSPAFYFAWTNGESGADPISCVNTTGAHVSPDRDDTWWGNFTSLNGSQPAPTPAFNWHDINETSTNDYALCKNFLANASSEDAGAHLSLLFYATLPSDSKTGNLTATVTATATLVDGQ